MGIESAPEHFKRKVTRIAVGDTCRTVIEGDVTTHTINSNIAAIGRIAYLESFDNDIAHGNLAVGLKENN